MSDVHNVIIIGSGPAGYTAGLYAARAMLEPLMFAGYMSGGQLMLTSDIENFPGYPEGIGGPEMMMQLREQAERFGLSVQDKNVESVDTSSQPFKVTVEGEDFFAHSLIVCTGENPFGLMHQVKRSKKDEAFPHVQRAMVPFSEKRKFSLSAVEILPVKKQPSLLVLLQRSRWFIVEMCSEPRPSCTNVLRTTQRLRSKPSVKSRNG